MQNVPILANHVRTQPSQAQGTDSPGADTRAEHLDDPRDRGIPAILRGLGPQNPLLAPPLQADGMLKALVPGPRRPFRLFRGLRLCPLSIAVRTVSIPSAILLPPRQELGKPLFNLAPHRTHAFTRLPRPRQVREVRKVAALFASLELRKYRRAADRLGRFGEVFPPRIRCASTRCNPNYWTEDPMRVDYEEPQDNF